MTDTNRISVRHPLDLAHHIGCETIGDWFVIDQKLIQEFAELSGDHNWIHLDVDRARRELPTEETIAHGLLTLCVTPRLGAGQLEIEALGMSINYGINHLRFTSMVPAGKRIRMRSTIMTVEPRSDGGVRVATKRVVEIEGAGKPAMVAETVTLIYPKEMESAQRLTTPLDTAIPSTHK